MNVVRHCTRAAREVLNGVGATGRTQRGVRLASAARRLASRQGDQGLGIPDDAAAAREAACVGR